MQILFINITQLMSVIRTVNSVLERLFSGQFSLNVRTATVGQLQGRTPGGHNPWPQPQTQPMLPYNGGMYVCMYVCMLRMAEHTALCAV